MNSEGIVKKIVLFTLVMLISQILYAEDKGDREKDIFDLQIAKPTAQSPDVGYAIQKKGEIANVFHNYGQLTDGYINQDFYNHCWPISKGAIAAGANATDDVSFLFAYKGNVIDGFTKLRNEDWGPVVGSWGRYHAKDQPDELKINDFPHLAVSDVKLSWPEGYDDSLGNFISTPGERHWPGKFRINIDSTSASYGEPVCGEFAADREIYCAIDDHDNLQNPPLGIRLDVQTYEYGRPYAFDFHFYEVVVTNTSSVYLDSCWWGYYYDFDYGEYEDECYYTYNCGLNPGDWDVIYNLDPVIDDPNEFETGVVGFAFFKTPKDMGITDSHYYLDTGPTTDEELWPIISSNPNDPNVPIPVSSYFHGSNVRLDDYTLTQTNADPIGFDWVVISATGPFSLDAGESVVTVTALVFGDDVEDFKANVNMAKDMYLKGYQGPSGPKAPKLYAVPGDEQVTLYWESTPETTPDPFSGEFDFEGYKIYRSQDGGQSWGEEINDGFGSTVGYKPVAQFDVYNSISGLDPLSTTFNLGSNTGIVHSWVDTDVENGYEYTYTITAYDQGSPSTNIQAFESARGATEAEDNFLKITPTPRAQGFIPPGVTYEHTHGFGKGYLDIEIVDPDMITNHTYQVAFVDSPSLTFNIIDATANETYPINYPINEDEMPVIDGFNVRVNGDDTFGDIKNITDEFGRGVFGPDNSDTTGSWYVNILPWTRGDFYARTSDYEIRFTPQGSNVGKALSSNVTVVETVPFEVWNTTLGKQVTAIVIDQGGDLTFAEGEDIYIINLDYQHFNIGESFPIDLVNDVAYKIAIMNAPEDTLNLIPTDGQIVSICTNRAFVASDTFQINFELPSFKSVTDAELSEVRVVPNPYIVNAAWETARNVRRLQFMFLPPICDILIYTIRGELVTKINHVDGTGSENWNITSDSNQELAYGVYIYIVKTANGKEHMGKFALIK